MCGAKQVAFAEESDWTGRSVLDIVRGFCSVPSMTGILRCAEFLGGHPGVKILRVKNRFANPTDGGWMVRLFRMNGMAAV